MVEQAPKTFSGELKTQYSKDSDYLIVRRDVETAKVIAAHGRILFMLDVKGRVVGAAVRSVSSGLSRRAYQRPGYTGWALKRKNE